MKAPVEADSPCVGLSVEFSGEVDQTGAETALATAEGNIQSGISDHPQVADHKHAQDEDGSRASQGLPERLGLVSPKIDDGAGHDELGQGENIQVMVGAYGSRQDEHDEHKKSGGQKKEEPRVSSCCCTLLPEFLIQIQDQEPGGRECENPQETSETLFVGDALENASRAHHAVELASIQYVSQNIEPEEEIASILNGLSAGQEFKAGEDHG